MTDAVDDIIQLIKGRGYNPQVILSGVLKEYGYILLKPPYSGKCELDNEFVLNIPEHLETAFRYASIVCSDEPINLEDIDCDEEDMPF